PVQLSATIDGATIQPSRMIWQVNGQQIGTGQELTYRFTSPGTYIVSFTATDENGGSASDSLQIIVDPASSPTATPTKPPQCTQVSSGATDLNVDLKYFSIINGARSQFPSGSHVEWLDPQLGNVFVPQNSSELADLGNAGYATITCNQLKSLTYGVPSVPNTN